MSKIIKASQIRQEEKLRQLFAEKIEIKSQSNEPEIEIIDEELNAAHEEAAVLIEQAITESRELRRQAEAEIEQQKEAGYQEGFRQGVEEGNQVGYEQVISEMQNLLQNMQQNLKRELDKAQLVMDSQVQGLAAHLIKLSTEIASKVIHRQVKLDPEIIIDQVENILQNLSRVKSLAIRVNPGDIQMVKSAEERFLQLTQGIDEIEFVIDHSLEPGGCIIETNSGGVDATIQTQIEIITSILMEGNGDEDA